MKSKKCSEGCNTYYLPVSIHLVQLLVLTQVLYIADIVISIEFLLYSSQALTKLYRKLYRCFSHTRPLYFSLQVTTLSLPLSIIIHGSPPFHNYSVLFTELYSYIIVLLFYSHSLDAYITLLFYHFP